MIRVIFGNGGLGSCSIYMSLCVFVVRFDTSNCYFACFKCSNTPSMSLLHFANVLHRAKIRLLAPDVVPHQRQNDRRAEDDNCPIHVWQSRVRGGREEDEDELDAQKGYRSHVDEDASTAEIETRGWERISEGPAPCYAADDDNVGGV